MTKYSFSGVPPTLPLFVKRDSFTGLIQIRNLGKFGLCLNIYAAYKNRF
jgi:hypothetical protein